MAATYYSKQELCNEIYRAVIEAEKPLTRLQITRAIGRKKSPHIVSMIEELTGSGWFKKMELPSRNALPVFAYSVGKLIDIAGACN